MVTAAEVLERLAYATARYAWLAIAWHLVILGAALLLLAHVIRPSVRGATLALTTPLLSVATVAALTGNPFNAIVFLTSALALAALGLRASGRAQTASPPAFAFGVAVSAYGLVYPHFIEPLTVFDYFYAAPTGVVPCPTLAVVIGLTLTGNGLDRAWSIALAALGLFYGLLGLIWLRVTLDLGLVAAAIGLFAIGSRRLREVRRPLHRRPDENGTSTPC